MKFFLDVLIVRISMKLIT